MSKNQEDTSCSMCKCETCCKLIPESVAMTAEGADYVKHFCGTECYEKWLRQQKETDEKSTSNDD